MGLLSWGGTMFEYLMPQLFQRSYRRVAVDARAARRPSPGKSSMVARHCVPWGVSESAFGALAANSDYHYRSFGVPGLGLKRGLAKDYVVSPYSTFLALEIDPAAAYDNLQHLAREGGLGRWGFYDAIDYTPSRLPAGKRSLPVRCYMAHHHGMSLLAMANVLDGGSVRRRFHAHPLVRAAELLLQERVPAAVPLGAAHPTAQSPAVQVPPAETSWSVARLTGGRNGCAATRTCSPTASTAVMVTSTGGGYSQCGDLAVTRWRPDATRDHWGQFLYLRDVRSGRIWSPTYQPTCVPPDAYEVIYRSTKPSSIAATAMLETHLEVAVSPENKAEVRQLKITNHGSAAGRNRNHQLCGNRPRHRCRRCRASGIS